MRAYTIAITAAAAVVIWTGTGNARSLRSDTGPAELPPASYTADQYIDSEGCAYVRAGLGTSATWVPRVTRDRQVLCGFRPTFARSAPRTPTQQPVASAPRSAPEPVETVSAPAPTTAEAMALAQRTDACKGRPLISARLLDGGTKLSVRCGPAPEPVGEPVGEPIRITPQQPAPVQPKPVQPRLVTAAPASAPAPVAQPAAPSESALSRARRVSACKGAPVLSARYNSQGQLAVRCGAVAVAAVAPVAKPAPQPVPSPAPVAQPLRVTVAAPASARTVQPVAIPKGYQTAWKDDRLNPNRAKGTAAGEAAMQMIWTQTVPRQLIAVPSGKDVTAQNAHIEYPYTDYAEQLSDYGAKPVARRTTVSTKSAVPAASGRYVQVGLFGDPANTRKAVALLQRQGLPVRLSRTTMRGKPVEVVMAGPFVAGSGAQAALSKVRRAGFADAYLK